MADRSFDETGKERILPAKELAGRYASDEPSANEDYLNEALRIRGEVLRIDNIISAVVPRVLGVGEPYSGTHLKVHLANRSDAETLRSGEESVFHGICQGLDERTSPTGETVGWIILDEAVVESD